MDDRRQLPMMQTHSENLERRQQENLEKQNSTKQISVYNDKLDLNVITEQCFKVAAIFNFPKQLTEVLRDRMIANNFTNQRAIDAVNYVIDNFNFGKTPNIAEFIQFDKKIDLLSHNDLLEMVNQNRNVFGMVVAIDTGLSRPMYVWETDFEKYPYFKKWVAKPKPKVEKPEEKEEITGNGEKVNSEKVIKETTKIFTIPKVEKPKRPVRKQYMRPMTAEEIVSEAEKLSKARVES